MVLEVLTLTLLLEEMDVTNRVLDHEVWRTVNCHGKKLDKEE